MIYLVIPSHLEIFVLTSVINFFSIIWGLSLELEFLSSDHLDVLALFTVARTFLAFLQPFIHSFVHSSHNTKCLLCARHTLDVPYKMAVVSWTVDIILSIHAFGQMKTVFSFLPFLWCLCCDRHMPWQYLKLLLTHLATPPFYLCN